jgi:hypothetical protein
MNALASPSGQHMHKTAPSPLDALAAELGAVAGQIEREAALRIDAALSDIRRVDAERELRFTALERRVETAIAGIKNGEPGASVTLGDVEPIVRDAVQAAVAGLPAPKDGEPGRDVDMGQIAALVDEAVSKAVGQIPVPADGKDADPSLIAELVTAAVSSLPSPPAGKDADPEVIRQMVDEAVRSLPPAKQGEPGAPGMMPLAKEHTDGVHYAGAVVTHEGSTYQASRDTGRAPPHEDWQCIARAGRDGRTFRICGTYAEGAEHIALDVVALNGASFVAKRDAPGPCPGEGWQMIAAQGKRGNPGERGLPGKGERGLPGQSVASVDVDGEGLLTLTNGDGTSVECDLYPLLAKVSG